MKTALSAFQVRKLNSKFQLQRLQKRATSVVRSQGGSRGVKTEQTEEHDLLKLTLRFVVLQPTWWSVFD